MAEDEAKGIEQVIRHEHVSIKQGSEHLKEKVVMILKDYVSLNTSLSDERGFGITIGVKE